MAIKLLAGIVFPPEENVSKLISRLSLLNRNEAIVLDKNKFIGVVNVRDISKRKINDPHVIKIKKFIRRAKTLPFNTPYETMIKNLLQSNNGFVVLQKEKKYFVLTKLNALQELPKNNIFKEKTNEDIMSSPFCLSVDDSISTGMSLIRDLGINVLPVLNHDETISGFVNSTILLKAETDRRRTKKGERSGEIFRLRDVQISSLMDKNYPCLGPEKTIEHTIRFMLNQDKAFVFIEKKNKLLGIVTAGDILKLIEKKEQPKIKKFRQKKELYLNISGINEEDPFIRKVLEDEIRNELRKLTRIIPIESVVIHVSRHHKTGRRTKYSIKAKILTMKGDFFANDFSWDITKAMRGILKKFEREIMKKRDKKKIYKRAP